MTSLPCSCAMVLAMIARDKLVSSAIVLLATQVVKVHGISCGSLAIVGRNLFLSHRFGSTTIPLFLETTK